MHLDKILGLASVCLGADKGGALKMIADGAQVLRGEAPGAEGQPPADGKAGSAALPWEASGGGGDDAQAGGPALPWETAAEPEATPSGSEARLPWEAEPDPPPSAAAAAPASAVAAPAASAPVAAAAAAPAPAAPASPEDSLDSDDWAFLQVMVAAAQSDGHVSPQEQANILQQAEKMGATPFQMQQLNRAFRHRVSVPQLVASVDSIAVRKFMYRCAFIIVSADKRVDPSEAGFLSELAKATELHFDVLGKIVR